MFDNPHYIVHELWKYVLLLSGFLFFIFLK